MSRRVTVILTAAAFVLLGVAASLFIACAVTVCVGCSVADHSAPTPAEASAGVVAPAREAERAATSATTHVKAADSKAAGLETKTSTRPAIPSDEVKRDVGAFRIDLAGAVADLVVTVSNAADAAQKGLALGGKLSETIIERDKLAAWKAEEKTHWLGPRFWRSWYWGLGIAGLFGLLSLLAPAVPLIGVAETVIAQAVKAVFTAGIPLIASVVKWIFKRNPAATTTAATSVQAGK